MAPSGFAAFLLFLGLVASNVYGDNTNNTLCENILNATLNNASLPAFNLTVNPTTLSSNTNYSVTLDGYGNFTILFQADSLSSPVGTWSPANNTCNGSSLFIDPFINNSSVHTTWTSPQQVTSVTIYAFIHNGTDTFRLHQTLNQEILPNTSSTEAPAFTTNNTESPKTTHTVSVATSTHPVTQTTSAASIEQSNLLSLALSLTIGLLLIPNKYLS